MKKVGEYIVTIYSVRDDEGKLHKWSAASTI